MLSSSLSLSAPALEAAKTDIWTVEVVLTRLVFHDDLSAKSFQQLTDR